MRIAILKPSALGDVVHALPVLTALRRRYADAHIAWVVNRSYASLLAGHPHLNAIIPFERSAFRRPWTALPYTANFAQQLRRRRFDIVLDLQGLLRTGLMAAATGAPIKLGFANAREGATRFYSHVIPVPDAKQIHAVERYWKFADYLGAGHVPKEFHVPISALERHAAERRLQALPRPWVAVVPGSRWATKCWPGEHYRELLNATLARPGGTAVFVGGPEDATLSATIAERLKIPSVNLCGKTSLPALAATLNACDAALGNDTGPIHLAAALGKPCVVPYTCTSPTLHGPFGVGGGVPTTVPCAASYLKKCPNGLICFQDLSPKKLIPTFDEVLRPWQSHSRSA
jgi:heptosyltransferase I